MSVQWTARQLAAIDVSRRQRGRLRGRGAGVGEDHGAGGVLPPAGGGGRGSAADSRDHVHREGRGQHAQETGRRRSSDAAGDTRAALERAWVSTVHGFCARLLRENAVFAGVDPEFRVADERESWRMQQDAMARGDGGAVRASGRRSARR